MTYGGGKPGWVSENEKRILSAENSRIHSQLREKEEEIDVLMLEIERLNKELKKCKAAIRKCKSQ